MAVANETSLEEKMNKEKDDELGTENLIKVTQASFRASDDKDL
jgi:hypothetical protein